MAKKRKEGREEGKERKVLVFCFPGKFPKVRRHFPGKFIVREDCYLGGCVLGPVWYHASVSNSLYIISILFFYFFIWIDFALFCAIAIEITEKGHGFSCFKRIIFYFFCSGLT